MKEPQLSGIATALAKQGRHGDDTLVHVSRKELETLQKYGDELGIHLTVNPQTGLPEAFNWGGMAGSVGLPLLVLAATAATGGAAAPWMLAAAGGAGGFGGTLAGGGSMDQALMSGVMGGIGGYGMGNLAGNLATEGAKAAVAEGATEAATNVAAEQGATNLLGSAGSTIPGVTPGVAYSTPTSLLGSSGSAIPGIGATATGSGLGAAGNAAQAILPGATTPLTGLSGASAAGNVAGTTLPGATTPLTQQFTQQQLMGKGLEAVTASPSAFGNFAWDNAKNIGMAGIGALGAGSTMNPQEQTITTEPEGNTQNPYGVEWYSDPNTGQPRTRAVRRAAEGGAMFSDYDAAEAGPTGGYAPGDGVNYAMGGGVADLGSYSDGGRTLRGPGDGVSDSIPATIEGKRPARLADGEFVVPARAVSELGNGSTEAGSKQLYKMLDRIAAKRKSGKGLAYEANPKKLLPA